jgi:thymidine phosphorylase
MNQPLGRAVGNALEVVEAVDTLKGRGPKDLESLSIELAARMVHMAADVGLDVARSRARAALASGDGLQKLREVIEAQGGEPRVCDDPSLLPRAAETLEIKSERDGRVVRLGARDIGRAAMILGAGRETLEGAVDPGVGLVFHKKVGDPVAVGEPIVTVHVGRKDRVEPALAGLRAAITVGPEAPRPGPLVIDMLS